MIERLTFTFLLIFVVLALYLLFRYWHMRRVSQITAAIPVEANRPRVLYFRSDNCPPCVTQAHYLGALEQAYEGRITIEKIDVDKDNGLASHYGIFTLPTILVVDQGGEVKSINYGLTATTKLAQQLENII